VIGIIGGSGLGESLGALPAGQAHRIDTPFGPTSGPIVTTEIGGVPVALLARHGEGHFLNPSYVPYRANIFALKTLGVTRILASGAVGSLREELAPRSLVVPDQVIDRTFRRAGTFYEELAVHVELASPFCPSLRKTLLAAGPANDGGTYVCMEGPQFSTRAESELHRSWKADLIGMTVMPEAKLAREAEICYALVALVTDYDCWRPHKTALDAVHLLEEIIGNLRAATENALALIRRALPGAAATGPECGCRSALALAIWSDRAKIPPNVRKELAPLLGRYVDERQPHTGDV
jgi:5'-methylthioadenosine phosphorylase